MSSLRTHESRALSDIAAERERQISAEGWTREGDDKIHANGGLAKAAACYARGSRQYWPWHPRWWKPSTRRRDLVKAGALIVAEIERLDRADLRQMVRVDASLFPAVFKMLVELEYANGGVNHLTPEPTYFLVPPRFGNDLAGMDAAVSQLTDDEMNIFVDGEEGEMNALAERSAALTEAHQLLCAMFDGEGHSANG